MYTTWTFLASHALLKKERNARRSGKQSWNQRAGWKGRARLNSSDRWIGLGSWLPSKKSHALPRSQGRWHKTRQKTWQSKGCMASCMVWYMKRSSECWCSSQCGKGVVCLDWECLLFFLGWGSQGCVNHAVSRQGVVRIIARLRQTSQRRTVQQSVYYYIPTYGYGLEFWSKRRILGGATKWWIRYCHPTNEAYNWHQLLRYFFQHM